MAGYYNTGVNFNPVEPTYTGGNSGYGQKAPSNPAPQTSDGLWSNLSDTLSGVIPAMWAGQPTIGDMATSTGTPQTLFEALGMQYGASRPQQHQQQIQPMVQPPAAQATVSTGNGFSPIQPNSAPNLSMDQRNLQTPGQLFSPTQTSTGAGNVYTPNTVAQGSAVPETGMFSTIGEGISSGWDAIGGMQGVSTGLSALSGIGQAYLGFQQLGLAEDQFDFIKNAWQKDYDMRLSDYNRRVGRQDKKDAAFAR